MRTFLVIFSVTVFVVALVTAQAPLNTLDDCAIANLKDNYRHSIYHLIVLSYKTVALHSDVNFVFSPSSIWIMLAAIAEGSDIYTQQQLFQLLNLPDDQCIRQKYYRIATSRAIPVPNVNIFSTRALLIDEGLTLNPAWQNFVTKNSLLEVFTAPMKSNPVATEQEIKRIMAANVPRLDLSGNSVLLDTIDYNGLWTTAFADAVVERAPFYNQEGQEIGAVDLMRVKRRARLGYVKSVNAKVLELSVGSNGRYKMMFLHLLERTNLTRIVTKIRNDIILEMFTSLRDSNVPIEVAIPRCEITGEVDVKTVLEDLGVSSPWSNPEATQYISIPPALPSSYVQRATVILDKHGAVAAPPEQAARVGSPTGLHPKVGTDFIANQPFLFGLFDSETYTPLVAVAFSKPVYSYANGNNVF